MLLMIDNYDSFTYTLVQYFEALDQEVLVKRNDQVSLAEIQKLDPAKIVISPGPCSPTEAGLSIDIIKNFYQKKAILGVCLGHQSIAQAFDATVCRARKVMHGKTSDIYHDGEGLFSSLQNPLQVTRYHSLVVQPDTLPSFINKTAWTHDAQKQKDELMALELNDYPVAGVQFHPESVLTESGTRLLQNFLAY